LTALRYLEDAGDEYRVIACTTNPQFFSSFPVTIEPLDDATIRAWRGPRDFIYRTKIMALMHVMDRYPGPALLLDSDTYFAESPKSLLGRLQPDVSIMDRLDGRIFNGTAHREFAIDLKRNFPGLVVPLADGSEFRTTEADATMWIAGAVGIHPHNRPLLDRVLRVSDAIYERIPHAFVEQFTFSEILRQNTMIIPSHPIIEHYWGGWVDPYFGLNKRDFVHSQIDAIFKNNPSGDYQTAMKSLRSTRIRKFRRPAYYRAITGAKKLLGKIIPGAK
jgi:hypothetical protein